MNVPAQEETHVLFLCPFPLYAEWGWSFWRNEMLPPYAGWGRSSLISLIQALISSGNIFTDSPRNNAFPAIGTALKSAKFTNKINHHITDLLECFLCPLMQIYKCSYCSGSDNFCKKISYVHLFVEEYFVRPMERLPF